MLKHLSPHRASIATPTIHRRSSHPSTLKVAAQPSVAALTFHRRSRIRRRSDHPLFLFHRLVGRADFLPHRLIFMVLGAVMMVAAHNLSESVVFYYGGALTLGIIVVVLIILFQGIKLLPTGRKNSLAIVLYSSVVGIGAFLLTYVVEMGVSEDMHNPVLELCSERFFGTFESANIYEDFR